MIVVEKTRDIGILKALGASTSGVRSIFLSYGLSLGLVGSGVGMAGGLLFVHYINDIEAFLSAVTHRKVFDDNIYYFDRDPDPRRPGDRRLDRRRGAVHRGGGERLAGAQGVEAPPGPGAPIRMRKRLDHGEHGASNQKIKIPFCVSVISVFSVVQNPNSFERPNPMHVHLSAAGIEKGYRKGKVAVPVLRGVDLAVDRGEMVAIVGQSGSGKSTFLHVLGFLDAPDAGEVRFEGRRIDGLGDKKRDALRNGTFGFIFQSYHLLPELSALENVMMPLMIRHGLSPISPRRKSLKAEATAVLERVGLGHRLTHKPSELSGGEMQRAAIARALVGRPGDPPRRRADGEPRRSDGAGGHRAFARLEPRAGAHYDTGHPRQPDRPAGRPDRPPRRGADRGVGGGVLNRVGRPSDLNQESPAMSQPRVYIAGKLFEKADAKISVFDHGLLYGDGVFEGIRSYSQQRLPARTARRPALRLGQGDPPQDPDDARARWPQPVVDTLAANKLTDAYIRLIVTRGAGSLGLDPRKTTDPQVIIITDSISLYPAELYQHGLKIVTAGTMRNHPSALNPRIKSLNYLNSILAKIEATNAGCLEALMLNHKGEVSECTGDNIFIVRKGEVHTPSIDAGILEGITRDAVIELARSIGLKVVERTMDRHDVYTADEVFLTGTAAEVIPVVECDGRADRLGPGRADHDRPDEAIPRPRPRRGVNPP